MNGTIHVVAGGAGHHLGSFFKGIPDWSLYRDYDFGFVKLTAFNRSSLLFEYKKSRDGKVYDSFTINREYKDILACVHDSCGPTTLASWTLFFRFFWRKLMCDVWWNKHHCFHWGNLANVLTKWYLFFFLYLTIWSNEITYLSERKKKKIMLCCIWILHVMCSFDVNFNTGFGILKWHYFHLIKIWIYN